MRFSVAQRKEMIEAGSGRFIGYIVDAEICEKTGFIKAFIVAEPKKILHIFQGEEVTKKVDLQQVLTIGKDVILVKGE